MTHGNTGSHRCATPRTRRMLAIFTSIFAFALITVASVLAQTANRTESSQYNQGFEVNNNNWNISGGTRDASRVPSGNNGITSKTGSFHGEAPLQSGGLGSAFTQWGGYNSAFPASGYTTSVDVYLNMTGANDTRFCFTSAINTTAGGHRRDFAFNAGFYSDAVAPGSGPRFVVSASNNVGRANSFPKNPGRDPFVITASGWYTFRHTFVNNGSGVLAVHLSIVNSAGATLKTWTLSDPSDVIGSTVGGNRYGWFAQNEFAFLAIDNSQRANFAASNVETVTEADLTATPNSTDWFFYNDENDTINNTLGTFVSGPATVPAGAGSVQISVNGTQRRNIATYQFSGTPLANINELKFSTYNPSAGNGGATDRSGYLQFNVDFNGSDTWQRRLVFLPIDNGTVVQDSWQEWDAFRNGSASWRYSGPTWPLGIGGGGEAGTTTKTWNQILTQYPGVRIRVSDSFLGIRVGEPYADGYTENIDKFVFGTAANTTIFDFEPLPVMVDEDGQASTTNCDAAGPADLTIQAAVDAASAGATIKVCPGNFNEDVTISGPNKANITLFGSGIDVSTITGPHAAGGGDTVLILSSPGVTIDGFTITRTGNSVPDWGTNPQNQGINVGASTNVTVRNSKITGNRNGIYVGQSSFGVTLRRNIIDFNRTGIHLVDNNSGLIEENFVTNNWTVGILYRCEGCGINPSPLTVRNNNISSNWYSDIEFREPATGGLLDMSGNYLGSNVTRTTGPAGEPPYTGQIPVLYGGTAVPPASHPTMTGAQSGRIDFSPYLNNGVDTQPATPGFQGNHTNVTVGGDSAQTNAGLNYIQEGINYVPEGGSVTAVSGTYSGAVTLNKAITLLGTPTITGAFNVTAAGAQVSPGFSPGIINTGNLSFVSGSTVNMELNGANPGTGHDQFNVTGTVNLGGATLNVTTGFAIAGGSSFVIVNNDGSDAVTGTFAGLAQNATFVVGGTTFTINYAGGSGNDVVLTATTVTCNTMSIPTNIQTLPNQQVVVPVNIDDTTGRGILSVTYTLSYNSSVLSYVGIDQVGTLSSGFNFTVNSTTPGTLIINLSGTTPLSGAGVLMNLRFMANGAIGTSSAANFSGVLLNEGVPCVNTSNGLITVISSTVSGVVSYGNSVSFKPVPNTALNAPGSPSVSGTSAFVTGAYTLSGFGPGPYTVTPSKSGDVNGISGLDAAQISQHVVGLITLNANQIAAADVSNNGTVSGLDASYISQWVVSIPNPSITGTWKFVPANRSYPDVNTAQTNQDYSGILMGEVTGNWTAPTGPIPPPMFEKSQIDPEKAIGVEVSKKAVESGSQVIVPVSIRDITGKGVIAYQFEVEYDPKVLEPQKVAASIGKTISNGMSVVSNSPEEGLLQVVVYGVQPIEGAGTLVNLRFNAIGREGTKSPITVKSFMLNEGAEPVLAKDGEVTIEAAAGSTINGRLLTATGEPVAGSRVVLSNVNGKNRSVLSDDEGRFVFGNLKIGESYIVSVDSKRYRFERQQVTIGDHAIALSMIANNQ